MKLLSWAIVGLLAGGAARILTGSEKRGCLMTIAVGLIGAMIGGALANAAWGDGVTGLDIRSIAISALGAIGFLLVLQAVRAISRRR